MLLLDNSRKEEYASFLVRPKLFALLTTCDAVADCLLFFWVVGILLPTEIRTPNVML